MKRGILLSVNGERREVFIEPNRTLLDVLREELSLTGVKEACGRGECGACTVLVDGNPVNSCITLAVEAEGKEIETIEGLSNGGDLHPLQEAFIEHHSFQCGFCTPGIIMTAKAFLDRNPEPTEEEIKNAVAGNICRCTGYDNIVDGILNAAEEIKK
ncbi:MAG: (2Fe-2S)-binding protein [Thermodesulfobacteriota bacterium]|nr:(2Fe-2S)-binding protein [Thermodesulfobacteriota bacterium]